MSDDKEKALTPVVCPEISIDEKGVMRDRKTGKLLPGTASPNPSGRPGGQKTLRRELKKKFGEDGKGLVKKLEEIILYGERILNMKRLFNIKMGLTAENDKLPKILLRPFKEGGSAGKSPNFDKLKNIFYTL